MMRPGTPYRGLQNSRGLKNLVLYPPTPTEVAGLECLVDMARDWFAHAHVVHGVIGEGTFQIVCGLAARTHVSPPDQGTEFQTEPSESVVLDPEDYISGLLGMLVLC